jgi:hypothetical protein
MNKSMENWWNDIDRGKTNTLEENPVSLSLRLPEENRWNDIDSGKPTQSKRTRTHCHFPRQRFSHV